ncbi:MAG: bifunctional 3-phenylpropionate/cinnamic acid dioxygenase ferredoxin subunit [Rhodococcus sp. (in: high G+C Gram-positive bacteria)]
MTTSRVDNWARVCNEDELSPDEGSVLDIDPPVAVWTVDGQHYATDDTCTHEDFSLAEGYIDGCEVECALHWAKFDVRTGEALNPPACNPLRTYPVKVTGGVVYVDLSSRHA